MKFLQTLILLFSACMLLACGGGSSSGSTASSIASTSSSSSSTESSSSSSSIASSSSSAGAVSVSPPENLNVTAGNSQVELMWNAAPNATSYNVYSAEESFSSIQDINNYASLSGGKMVSGITNTNHVVIGLTNATQYYFVVTAVNAAIESDKSEEKSAVPEGFVSGLAIDVYTDVEFALNAGDADYGRFFSFAAGRIYKDSEINETTGPLINIVFESLDNTLHYFDTPTVTSYNIPNATLTEFINYEAIPTISTEAFDSMTDASSFIDLTIEETNDGFGNNTIPHTILFQIASGQKGVIKTKSINANRILVDIKVQK